MAQLALEAAPDRFSLVGHSMGARVALEVYRLAPARVERLALLDTGVHLPQPGEAEKRHALLHIGRSKGAAALVELWLPPMIGPERRQDESLMAPLRRMCIEAGVDAFEAQITALLNRPEVESLLPDIRCPVLVGVGRQDAWSPVEQHEAMAAAIPGAELEVFEKAGHMAPVEAPEAVNSALRRWLERPAAQDRKQPQTPSN
jgi:pimeloyl-ACP methyl ester carboxylesterase